MEPDARGRDFGHRSQHAVQQDQGLWPETSQCGRRKNSIHLISVVGRSGSTRAEQADVSIEMLDDLAAELARIFQISCHVHEENLAADFAYDLPRGQYRSTPILQRLESLASEPPVHFLGVTAVDLFIPILTFVFGEAQLGGCCAVVSLQRLRE